MLTLERWHEVGDVSGRLVGVEVIPHSPVTLLRDHGVDHPPEAGDMLPQVDGGYGLQVAELNWHENVKSQLVVLGIPDEAVRE